MSKKKNALRLTFSYDHGVVQLTSQQEVDMVLPPADAPARGPEQGFWAELRDDSNQTLFRRVLHNPMPVDAEVFSDVPGKTVSRAPHAPTSGMFTIVVPNDDKAAALALFSSDHEVAPMPAQPPPGLSAAAPFQALRAVAQRRGAAQEIARFDLKVKG